MKRTTILSMAVSLCLPTALIACLWDVDTLRMETARFPDALELITGKFLRHSEAYYLWRIEDRTKRLKKSTDDPRVFDDLSVAYDKTGQHDLAIETMLRKEELHPGLYETAANLGTHYIHAGQFEKGLEFIDKALEINPDAHFGRERYQKYLVEFLIKHGDESGELNLPFRSAKSFDSDSNSFLVYVMVQHGAATKNEPDSRYLGEYRIDYDRRPEIVTKAVKGILGMMKFGQHDSPILLQVLAELLLTAEPDQNARLLAARCFWKASYESEDTGKRAVLRGQAHDALLLQTDGQSLVQVDRDRVEAEFKKELAEADAWYSKIVADEELWISQGHDVDKEFAAKHFAEPEVLPSGEHVPEYADHRQALQDRQAKRIYIILTILVIAGLALLTLLIMLMQSLFKKLQGRKTAEGAHESSSL